MPFFEAALTLVNVGGTVHHLKTATIFHALQNYGDYFEKVNNLELPLLLCTILILINLIQFCSETEDAAHAQQFINLVSSTMEIFVNHLKENPSKKELVQYILQEEIKAVASPRSGGENIKT